MRTSPHASTLLIKGPFFESIERYTMKEADFIDFLRDMAPTGWRFSRKDIWFRCNPPFVDLPNQGWKFHISATRANCQALVRTVAPLLFARDVPFKLAGDEYLLSIQLGKSWPRAASGKFMTIYPRSQRDVPELAEALHNATREFEGPYILSDMRYSGSKVLFYRYGTIVPAEQVSPSGIRETVLRSEDGTQEMLDRRTPYFSLPPWVTDIFDSQGSNEEDRDKNTLNAGRYHVKRVLQYSNSGGVYLADDVATGRQVVIKEARPFVAWTSRELDARATLDREARILRRLSGLGIAPDFVDIFDDWEHRFLVQEYLEGETLAKYMAREGYLARTRPTENIRRNAYDVWRRQFIEISGAIAALHSQNIVFSDLSPGNVLLLRDGGIRLIDFEGSWEANVDAPTGLNTPGFAPHHAPERAGSSPSADLYALAAMMVASVFAITRAFESRPDDVHSIVREVLGDAGIPEPIVERIVRGLSATQEERPSAVEFAALLRAHEEPGAVRPTGRDWSPEQLRRVIEESAEFAVANATPDRRDRLFPPDFRVFHTNPISLAYGSLGTLVAYQRCGVELPRFALDWSMDRLSDYREALPPGFTQGTAGIAWCLSELGLVAEARDLFLSTEGHPLLSESSSVATGLAGRVFTALKLATVTGEDRFAEIALRDASQLTLRATQVGEALSWSEGKHTYFGLQHGASGIALALLYAGTACNAPSLIDIGERALSFDLSQARDTEDGGISFPYRANYDQFVCPYWEFGSAGIGAALLRYQLVRPRPQYDELLAKLLIELERKYTMIPGKLNGLAGLTGTLIDGFVLLGRTDYLHAAKRTIDGILLHAVKREGGYAFTGSSHNKFSCDYGAGSAGSALALHRFMTRSDAEFMLDELIIRTPQAQSKILA
jgi:serine/threonine protein kinase